MQTGRTKKLDKRRNFLLLIPRINADLKFFASLCTSHNQISWQSLEELLSYQ